MEKRSFLMVYDNQWNVPNGDPFTGEQRFDNASGKIMVSDLRIKRFIRDKIMELSQQPVFCQFDSIEAKKIKKSITGAAFSFRKYLFDRGLINSIDNVDFKKIPDNLENIMKEFVDVRLFGGILTEEGANLSIDGAVQFKNLSSSVNKVNLEVFQNTTVFPSKIENKQGSIGTTSLVPYAIVAVEGWLDELTAKNNNLSDDDIDLMLSCMWLGIRDKNSKSKSGQTPIVLFEIIYEGKEYKFNSERKIFKPIKQLDSCIQISSSLKDEDIRSSQDYELDLSKLFEVCSQDNVKKVNFFTENDNLKKQLELNNKFDFKTLY